MFWLLRQFFRLRVTRTGGRVVITHPCGLSVTKDSEALYFHYPGVVVQSSAVLSLSDDGTKAWTALLEPQYPSCSLVAPDALVQLRSADRCST
jgi:hypothetical protein